MTWRRTIESHYQDIWGIAGVPCLFAAGPIGDLPSDFSVLMFPPHDDRPMWTYATCGMSQPADGKPMELHMFSPVASEEIVELLVVTAHYHRTGSPLGLGHSVNFGRPWLDRSEAEFGLISLPYLDGPTLETLETGASPIKFYWLIPITSSEVEYKKLHGLEALETRFEEGELDYLDPARKSVA